MISKFPSKRDLVRQKKTLRDSIEELCQENKGLRKQLAAEKSKSTSLMISKFENPCEYYLSCPLANPECLSETKLRTNCQYKAKYKTGVKEAEEMIGG